MGQTQHVKPNQADLIEEPLVEVKFKHFFFLNLIKLMPLMHAKQYVVLGIRMSTG